MTIGWWWQCIILDWILDQLLRTFNYGLRLLLLFSPSSEYSGLISFRIGWFDFLSIQGTLKQHHSLKASILWHSAFFTVQLSHLYMTSGKTKALNIWIFVGKWCLCFVIMLSRFVIAFLQRSKHILISCLLSLSSDFGAQENIICHCFLIDLLYMICFRVKGTLLNTLYTVSSRSHVFSRSVISDSF